MEFEIVNASKDKNLNYDGSEIKPGESLDVKIEVPHEPEIKDPPDSSSFMDAYQIREWIEKIQLAIDIKENELEKLNKELEELWEELDKI